MEFLGNRIPWRIKHPESEASRINEYVQYVQGDPKTFAASSATQKEIQAAKGAHADGSKPVKPEPKIWRPQVKNEYIEPEGELDPLSPLKWMSEPQGRVAIKDTTKMAPRQDILQYDPSKHRQQYDDEIQWDNCPDIYKPIMECVIKSQWDCFDKSGISKPILGYLFNIDTGPAKPVCVKQPRYGPHESRVIRLLIEEMQGQGILEDDFGPWAAQVVLAAKPNQDHVHWTKYKWRLCVSFRKLNAITKGFKVYVWRCDDAIQAIGRSMFFITIDLLAGYWQVALHPMAKEKTAFYVPEGKKHFTVMPMGILNAHAFFNKMMYDVKTEWQTLYQSSPEKAIRQVLQAMEEFGSHLPGDKLQKSVQHVHETLQKALHEGDPGALVITDDIFFHDTNDVSLIAYFLMALVVMKRYRITVSLRKSRFFLQRQEFVGIDVLPEGNTPAKSKYGPINKIATPKTFKDIRYVIGLPGFYSPWIPHFETLVSGMRKLLKKEKSRQPADEKSEQEFINKNWTPQLEADLQEIKKAVLSGPVLKRPDPKRRFYLKSDWSSKAMANCLCQPDETPEAEAAMRAEIEGGKCEFDKTISGLRLRPIAFNDRLCTEKEQAYHSYTGEAASGRKGMRKHRHWLVGVEFTWITDCSGVVLFLEGEDDVTHVTQRWRMELLAYNFTVYHRPERMLFECDLMTRYEAIVHGWRENSRNKQGEEKNKTGGPITAFAAQTTTKYNVASITNNNPVTRGPDTVTRTELAKICDNARMTWILGDGLETATAGADAIGCKLHKIVRTDPQYEWQEHGDCANLRVTMERWHRKGATPEADWMIVPRAQDYNKNLETLFDAMHSAIETAKVTAICLAWPTSRHNWKICEEVEANIQSSYKELDAKSQKCDGETLGADFKSSHIITVIAPKRRIQHMNARRDGQDRSGKLSNILDPPNDNYSDYIAESEAKNIFDADHIGPEIADRTPIGRSLFTVQSKDMQVPATIRGIRPWETLRLVGLDENEIKGMINQPPVTWTMMIKRVQKAVPAQVWSHILAQILDSERDHTENAEDTGSSHYGENPLGEARALVYNAINKYTTYPMPDRKAWIDALEEDNDLTRLRDALKNKRRLDTGTLQDKGYSRPYQLDQFEVEDGILYEYEEPKSRHIRQLRRAVVPLKFREVVMAAYHAAPLAGHMDEYKTYYRIAARYWWPKMSRDIKEAVRGCAHCRAANATSHKAAKIYQSLTSGEPFEVCSLDVWTPGTTKPTEQRMSTAKRRQLNSQYVFTYLCTFTGFASHGITGEALSSATAATVVFTHFFVPRGMPKLVLIDEGSEFKDMLQAMLKQIHIQYYLVSAENHDGILNERLHRYMNKVEKIHTVDCDTYQDWQKGVAFSIYAWNACPVAGTDVQRAFAAVGKTFQFPLDTAAEDEHPQIVPKEGEAILNRIDVMFPLWWRQKTILKLLNDERRAYHRMLKNKGKTSRKFEPGDLVMVRKQVKSNAAQGKPAKLTIRIRGPYRVVSEAPESTESYLLQKVPTLSRLLGTKSKIVKESSFRLEKIPSRLVVHKRVDGPDTRWIKQQHPLSHNPLEHALGLPDFGVYAKDINSDEHAFVKLQDMWEEEVDGTEEDDIEDNLEEWNDPTRQDQIRQVRTIMGEAPTQAKNTETVHTQNKNNKEKTPTNSEAKAKTPQQGTAQTGTNKAKEKTSPKQRRVNTQQNLPMRLVLEILWQRVQESNHKLFIIATKEQGDPMASWDIVQIDGDETSEKLARTKGQYHCRWYTKKYQDAQSKKTKQCAYWPLIRELDLEGNMMAAKPIKPGKVESFLARNDSYAWYQKEVNVAEDGIYGPFEFEKGFTIPNEAWEVLAKEAPKVPIDVADVNRVVPHKVAKRKLRA